MRTRRKARFRPVSGAVTAQAGATTVTVVLSQMTTLMAESTVLAAPEQDAFTDRKLLDHASQISAERVTLAFCILNTEVHGGIVDVAVIYNDVQAAPCRCLLVEKLMPFPQVYRVPLISADTAEGQGSPRPLQSEESSAIVTPLRFELAKAATP